MSTAEVLTMRTVFLGVVVTGLFLAGCPATVSDARGPDGEAAHIIRCHRSEGCYEAASEACPEGYVLRSTAISQRLGSEILVSCKNDVFSAR